MGKETQIAWADSTFNPWWGCTKVSPGCDHCYAEAFDKRVGGAHWGKAVPRRIFSDSHWNEPLNWQRAAVLNGKKHKVFCASMADVMDDEAPDGQRERLWGLIDSTPNLIWLLLTKRPQRYHRYIPKEAFRHKNVWLGTSAEDQALYNVRWPYLRLICDELKLTSFISYEPALGPLSVNLWTSKILKHRTQAEQNLFDGRCKSNLVPDWIIMGGESGAGRRPMQQEWAENLKRECEMWEIKFFMKQMSARTPEQGAQLIPAHLLIRQFPNEV